VLSGDGVVPVSQLSFTKAEEAHFKGAKKMGDVGSRSAMNSYFDHLGEEQQAAHKAALKHAFSGQSLNQWFNKMGQKYFKATEVEKAERKAHHPGQLSMHRQVAKQVAQVEQRSAEDPDDVPMEKKESVEDKMIQAVADYQQKQKATQTAKFARDNAEVKKEISDVKKVEQAATTKAKAANQAVQAHEAEEKAAVEKVVDQENHFKQMREKSEKTAEKQQAKALKTYKSTLKSKEEKSEALQVEAATEQKKAVAEYKAVQSTKAEAAKKPVEERERKVRQSVKQVEAQEDKTREDRSNRQIKHEQQDKKDRVEAKKVAEKRGSARAAKHAAYEVRQKEIREEAKEKADERKEERTERSIKRKQDVDAAHAKTKAFLAKKAEQRKVTIAANIKKYNARKAAEKARLTGEKVDNVPLDAEIKAAEKIQDHVKVAPFQIKKSAAGEKVKIGFYMESMCPGCKYYTKTVLAKLMEKPDFVSMVDFTLYPYGNGQLSGDAIQCQHGEKECEGNTILACMQEHYPITTESTGFVPAFVCMEEENGVPKEDFKKCAFTHNVDYDKVMTCANGDQGKTLALAAAKNTEALDPPHEYAPWLTLNGAPMRDDAYDLQKNVCKAYDAGDQAASGLCSEASLQAIMKKDRAMLHDGGGLGFSVCHKDEWNR